MHTVGQKIMKSYQKDSENAGGETEGGRWEVGDMSVELEEWKK